MVFNYVVVGLSLLAIGLIGMALDYYTGWMWLLIIAGLLNIIWGYLLQPPGGGTWHT